MRKTGTICDFVCFLALSCASSGGLKIIDENDTKKPAFAEPKSTFTASETDLMIPLKPLPPGNYEITVTSDDGRRESQTFEVRP
jgi:hypothetical protein